MGDVTLRVGGFDTRLGCADGDEPRLLALGAMVDQHAQLARQLDPGTTEARMLLMAALMLADELGEARARLDERPVGEPAASPTIDQDAVESTVRRRLDDALADELDPVVARLEAVAARFAAPPAHAGQAPADRANGADDAPRPTNWVVVSH